MDFENGPEMTLVQISPAACKRRHLDDLPTEKRAAVENAVEFCCEALQKRRTTSEELKRIAKELKALNKTDKFSSLGLSVMNMLGLTASSHPWTGDGSDVLSLVSCVFKAGQQKYVDVAQERLQSKLERILSQDVEVTTKLVQHLEVLARKEFDDLCFRHGQCESVEGFLSAFGMTRAPHPRLWSLTSAPMVAESDVVLAVGRERGREVELGPVRAVLIGGLSDVAAAACLDGEAGKSAGRLGSRELVDKVKSVLPAAIDVTVNMIKDDATLATFGKLALSLYKRFDDKKLLKALSEDVKKETTGNLLRAFFNRGVEVRNTSDPNRKELIVPSKSNQYADLCNAVESAQTGYFLKEEFGAGTKYFADKNCLVGAERELRIQEGLKTTKCDPLSALISCANWAFTLAALRHEFEQMAEKWQQECVQAEAIDAVVRAMEEALRRGKLPARIVPQQTE